MTEREMFSSLSLSTWPLNYPATSCITCCLNHPDKLISMPGTRVEEDIILSPFALEPMKSHSLHCKDTARPCSPRASYTPSHAQAHSWMQHTWQRHTSLFSAFLSWVLCTHRTSGSSLQRWPHRTGAHTQSLAHQPGPAAWLLCLLPDSHLPLRPLLPIPQKRQPCVHKPAHVSHCLCAGDGEETRPQVWTSKQWEFFNNTEPKQSSFQAYSFHPHFVLRSKKGRREETCSDGNLHAASVYTLCSWTSLAWCQA